MALLGLDEQGNVQLRVVKVRPTNPTKPSVYMTPQECVFGSYMAPVQAENVIEELAIAQLKAVNQKPVWYDINTVDEDAVDEYHLAENLPLPNRAHYIALTKLYRDFCNKFDGGVSKVKTQYGTGALEVGTKIFIKDNELFFFIFKQEVSAGAVNWTSTDELMDIVTGQVFKEADLAGMGYRYVGLSHSHNTMSLSTPSNIDDTQEIGTPGIYFLHSTFTNTAQVVSSYVQTTTLTTGHKRYNLTGYIDVLTTMEWINGPSYHQDVFGYITRKVYAPVKTTTTYSGSRKPYSPPPRKQSSSMVPHGYWDDYDGYHDVGYTYVEGDDPFEYAQQGWQYPEDTLPGTIVTYDDSMTPLEKVQAFMINEQLSATEISELLMEI